MKKDIIILGVHWFMSFGDKTSTFLIIILCTILL